MTWLRLLFVRNSSLNQVMTSLGKLVKEKDQDILRKKPIIHKNSEKILKRTLFSKRGGAIEHTSTKHAYIVSQGLFK